MASIQASRLLPAIVVATGLAAVACEKDALSPGKRVGGAALALGNDYGAWSTPSHVEEPGGTFNTASVDGCPFISPDGKAFYMASNRPLGVGGLDIWVSTRSSVDEPWGPPENLGEPVNSAQDDFCPTISRDGKLLYFVSKRPGCGTLNASDIYVARLRADKGFEEPAMLPCDDAAPFDAVNSPYDEFSPFPQLDPAFGPTLYFSSFRPDGHTAAGTDSDVYWSRSHGGTFGQAEIVPGVNSSADDGQPNVAADGLELFFYSTRTGGVGAADLYVALRAHATDAWSAPANLGAPVNSAGAETRPSLSWDGSSLYFGSNRAGGEGMTDIWVTTRQRLVPGGP
jgi:Tol biopolymer transport system component